MKIEHFCCCEAWEHQVFSVTLLCRMGKGGKQFSIQLYCFPGRRDDFFSPSCSFRLLPWALFLREEYLHECVSVVLLGFFLALKQPSVLWSSVTWCVTSQSRALPGVLAVPRSCVSWGSVSPSDWSCFLSKGIRIDCGFYWCFWPLF